MKCSVRVEQRLRKDEELPFPRLYVYRRGYDRYSIKIWMLQAGAIFEVYLFFNKNKHFYAKIECFLTNWWHSIKDGIVIKSGVL